MNRGLVQVYCGGGKGKTTAALGQGIRAASQGKSVIIIQFLKRKNEEEIDFIRRLEPEIKLFRFEKNEVCFDELDDDSKNEEIMNIKNGMNFAKKVLVTGECNVLILDEILGLLDHEIIGLDDVKVLIDAMDEDTELIMTGIHACEKMIGIADAVYRIETVKTPNP